MTVPEAAYLTTDAAGDPVARAEIKLKFIVPPERLGAPAVDMRQGEV